MFHEVVVGAKPSHRYLWQAAIAPKEEPQDEVAEEEEEHLEEVHIEEYVEQEEQQEHHALHTAFGGVLLCRSRPPSPPIIVSNFGVPISLPILDTPPNPFVLRTGFLVSQ